jgi:Ribbon-helix-helix protein, copG family
MSTIGTEADRVTVNISPDQAAWLNHEAKTRSTSVSDILRRLIDETRGAYLTPASVRLPRRLQMPNHPASEPEEAA